MKNLFKKLNADKEFIKNISKMTLHKESVKDKLEQRLSSEINKRNVVKD